MDEDEFCTGVYRSVQDKGISGWYVHKSHLELERITKRSKYESILEVGGNIGEHIKYVESTYSEYILTDYRDTKFNSENVKIKFRIADVQNLPFADSSFDRTIATCLLHHVDDPLKSLEEIRRVTKEQGTISILIPCDPGLAYRMAKHFGVSRKWIKN